MAEYFIGDGYYGEFLPEKKVSGDQFVVEDLLDFSNEDAMIGDGLLDNVASNSADSSTATTVVDSCNSSLSGGENQFSGSFGSRSFGDTSFSGELCVPIDDLAELEWLSNFVEDSFSTKQNLQQSLQFVSMSNSKPPTPESSCTDNPAQPEPATTKSIPHPAFHPETPLPSKSRSKRSRAAPCDWTTRLLHLTPTKPQKPAITIKKRESPNTDPVPRKCLHCAAEKTPQWRTGPMGPKTLCNACGVRYKSGRLVSEYRPAASPTFVSTKHSNSHRKVLELRRQKEIQRVHQHQQHYLSQSSIFGVPNGGDDYLMNHCSGPSFRHMI